MTQTLRTHLLSVLKTTLHTVTSQFNVSVRSALLYLVDDYALLRSHHCICTGHPHVIHVAQAVLSGRLQNEVHTIGGSAACSSTAGARMAACRQRRGMSSYRYVVR